MRRFSFKPALTLRGRKFHGIRGFSGKPFHPPLTDVPVGAYVIAPLLDIISFFGRGNEWAAGFHSAAGYVFVAGAVVSGATALTGLADWLDTEAGTQIRRMANAHAVLMLLMTAIVLADLAYRFLVADTSQTDVPLLMAAVAIMTLVTVGGTIGGSLVYDFGFNVETAEDNPVYHKHASDILHPHDQPQD